MFDRIDLRTPRLRIRHFAEDDLDACVEFRRRVFASDEPRSEIENWLRWTIASYRELAKLGQPPYADYAIELHSSGAFIGSAGIVPTVIPWKALKDQTGNDLLSPEIGLFWAILPEHRQQGYASEAGRAMLDFLFKELRAERVVATTEFDNIASQRTISRLGMRLLRNPGAQPSWCQVVGVIDNPDIE